MIKVYTDGSCTADGEFKGCGAWAYLIMAEKAEMEHAEGVRGTTVNRMEIEAVIQALMQLSDTSHLYDDLSVLFHSDSKIVVETLRKGGTWKRKLNLDCWKRVDELIEVLTILGFDIDFVWVKGHSVDAYNKRVDKLATKARDFLKQVPVDVPVWL
jgi:ribonuclease HI